MSVGIMLAVFLVVYVGLGLACKIRAENREQEVVRRLQFRIDQTMQKTRRPVESGARPE